MKNLWISLKFTLVMCVVLTIGYVLVLRLTATFVAPNDGEAAVVEWAGYGVAAANGGQLFTPSLYSWRPPALGAHEGGPAGPQ